MAAMSRAVIQHTALKFMMKPLESASCAVNQRWQLALNAIDGIDCPAPDGAFYVFADISGLIGRTRPDGTVIGTDSDFAAALLELGEVAIVPGVAFGLSPAFRLSFAAADDVLDEALGRIARVVASLN